MPSVRQPLTAIIRGARAPLVALMVLLTLTAVLMPGIAHAAPTLLCVEGGVVGSEDGNRSDPACPVLSAAHVLDDAEMSEARRVAGASAAGEPSPWSMSTPAMRSRQLGPGARGPPET